MFFEGSLGMLGVFFLWVVFCFEFVVVVVRIFFFVDFFIEVLGGVVIYVG